MGVEAGTSSGATFSGDSDRDWGEQGQGWAGDPRLIFPWFHFCSQTEDHLDLVSDAAPRVLWLSAPSRSLVVPAPPHGVCAPSARLLCGVCWVSY